MDKNEMVIAFTKALNHTDDPYMKSIWEQKIFSLKEKENKQEERNV